MSHLSAISLVLFMYGAGLSQECDYYYSEQPQHTLSCDPYETSELRLECTAYGPASAEFHLAWLSDSTSSPLQGADGAELLRGGESDTSILSQMQEHGTTKIIRSQLRIQLQRNASTAVRGFWCSLTVASEIQTVPSQGVVLHNAERYSHLPSCGNRAQSSHQEKCALQLSVASNTVMAPVAGSTPWSPIAPSSSSTKSSYPTQSPLSVVSTWQHPAPSNQISSPTMSVLPGIPPVAKERSGLVSIVFPILACLFGAVSVLCLVTCVCTQWFRRRKNTSFQKKQFATTNHTYSLSNSIYHCERQGVDQGPATPSLSPPMARNKLSESQNISIWSNDQYVEMATTQRGQHGPSSSTLDRTGLQSSFKGPFSYEVPLPCWLEPDYASIPTLHDQYLIPTEMDPRLYENSHIERQQSPSSCDNMYIVPPPKIYPPPSPAPPPARPLSNSHHYEEVIHTTVNTAYLETVIPIAGPSTDTAAPMAADST